MTVHSARAARADCTPRRHRVPALLAVVALALGTLPAGAGETALVSDTLVVGGPDDFAQVRHLVLRGSQEAIGRALGRLAREELGTRPWPSRDERVTRVAAEYIARLWPAHHARMRGAADALGARLDDHTANLSVLGYDLGDAFGCTVAFYPPELTVDGEPVLSRNLDFTSGTSTGRRPQGDQRAALSRPFVIESYPDEGHASLFTCSMDLLGSAFDGVNEHGLTVALLSDRVLMRDHEMIPTGDLAVGLSEIQVPRFLLETCADVDEAMDALLQVRQYYAFVPCHYVLGDARGRAAVFEASPDRNSVHFIEAPGEVLVSTNFLLHRTPEPRAEDAGGRLSSLGRYQAVCDQLDEAGAPYLKETIVAAHRAAAFDGPGPPAHLPYAPQRTLWHALYYPARAALRIDFYLGEGGEEGEDPDRRGWPLIRRSGYFDFALDLEGR